MDLNGVFPNTLPIQLRDLHAPTGQKLIKTIIYSGLKVLVNGGEVSLKFPLAIGTPPLIL